MRFLKILLAVHFTAGLVFAVIFQQYFQYASTVVVLHLLLLSCVLTAALLPYLYLHYRGFGRAIYLYTLLALPILDFLLLLVYSGNVISNITWSGNITLQLLRAYIADLAVMRQTLPVLNIYLAALPLAFLALLLAYRALFLRYYDPERDRRKINVRYSAYAALAVLATAILLQISFDKEDPGIWAGEPLSNLFLDYIPMFDSDPELPQLQAQSSRNSLQTLASSEQPNVIIIMVDALRADHLKPYGYQRDTSPFLNLLHAQGDLISVDMVHSSCSESACGILSVLTGNEYAQIRSNSTHLGNILQANGYTSSFILTGNHAWGGLRSMYGADLLIDGEMRESFSVNDDAGIIDDLRQLDLTASEPNFLYIHLYSAHELGLRHRQFNEFQPFQPSLNPLAALFSDEEDRHQQEINYYDNGIVQADFFIAQIFAQLEQKGILQNSIVYISSDHGQAFGEHGHHGHTRYLYEEHTRIPLLIFDSRPLHYQNTQYATHIDFLPTILESLDLQPNIELAGRSLLLPAPENRLTRHSSTLPNGWKLNLMKRGDLIYKHMWEGTSYEERGSEMLFEITADPGESENLIGTPIGAQIVELATAAANR